MSTSLGQGSAVGEKGKKRGQIGKKLASSGLGRGKFPLPGLPLSSLRSPNFFAHADFFSFSPKFGAWSKGDVNNFGHPNSICHRTPTLYHSMPRSAWVFCYPHLFDQDWPVKPWLEPRHGGPFQSLLQCPVVFFQQRL